MEKCEKCKKKAILEPTFKLSIEGVLLGMIMCCKECAAEIEVYESLFTNCSLTITKRKINGTY